MDSRTLQRRFQLNRKHALFALEYATDGNGAAAAIRAGYSERTARQTAYRLLTNVYILQAVEAAFSERMERLQITGDDVVRRLVNLAFTDIDAFAEWEDGHLTLKDLQEVPVDKRGALAGIEETAQGLRIKMADRMPALAILARHLGVLPTVGTREGVQEHARVAYERTVTEKWNLDALSNDQLKQFDDIVRTIQAGQSRPDA